MNSFFEELEKIANVKDDEGEEMNPDTQEKASENEVAEKQEKNTEEKEEKKANHEDDMREVIASALPEYGALAKIIEFVNGGEHVSEDLQKEASNRLEYALQGESEYVEIIEKTAGEIFSNEENVTLLHSEEGMEYVLEQLASFLESEELDKQADEEGSFVNKVREKATDFYNATANFVKAKTGITELESELAQAQNELGKANSLLQQEALTHGVASPGVVDSYNAAQETVEDVSGQLKNRKLGMGLAAGALAGGAMYGGKKLYEATHKQPEQEEQVASEESEELEKSAEVLSTSQGNDTLKTEFNNENNGGHDKMSKELVRDFLKIAGASGLISIANNESLDMELRKEASDRFDEIANLGRSAMDEALVKVAQEIYTEDQLHEIVAGKHTGELFSKVAFFTTDIHEMSTSELEKVANAGGVAAKGVAGALTDSKKNIENTIAQDKKKTEGQGREYVGDTATSGKVGGQLVGGLEGYNVINEPGKYDIEQTAAAIEEAVLMKRAAAESYAKADAFIKQWAPKVYGN